MLPPDNLSPSHPLPTETLMQLYLQMGRTFYSIRRTIDLAMASHLTEGLTPTNVQILLFLEQRPGHQAIMQEIVQGISGDFAARSRQIAALTDQGWLIKRSPQDDRRKRTILLSPKAVRLLPVVHRTIALALAEAFSPLSGIEAMELLRMNSEIFILLQGILPSKDNAPEPLNFFP